MQLATIANTNTQTMSSREIAELVESRHSDIVRSILRLMANKVISGYAPMAYTHPQNGQTYECYHLNKRDSLVVVAQNCPQFTARIVDRWQELEEKERSNSLVLPNFTDPAEAAIAWATEYKAKQLAMQQLEAAKPKVEYVDKYVERNNLKSITDVAKEMGISSKALGVWLRENGHAWANKVPVRWTQPFIDKGYGEMKQYTTAGGFDGTQAMFTAAGDVFVKQAYK